MFPGSFSKLGSTYVNIVAEVIQTVKEIHDFTVLVLLFEVPHGPLQACAHSTAAPTMKGMSWILPVRGA